MSGDTVPCGNLGKHCVPLLAERCAQAIAAGKNQRAVTVDPRGRVAVETVRAAVEGDLLGVYTAPRLGAWMTLAAQIERDLNCEIKLRSRSRRAA